MNKLIELNKFNSDNSVVVCLLFRCIFVHGSDFKSAASGLFVDNRRLDGAGQCHGPGRSGHSQIGEPSASLLRQESSWFAF